MELNPFPRDRWRWVLPTQRGDSAVPQQIVASAVSPNLEVSLRVGTLSPPPSEIAAASLRACGAIAGSFMLGLSEAKRLNAVPSRLSSHDGRCGFL